MKMIFIILLLTISFLHIYSQNNLCNGADPFCTATTYNFPAPVNAGNAEIGPDYGCLNSTQNPVWHYILIDQPGNLVLDIHSSTGSNLDYICWGPFNSSFIPCTAQLISSNIVDCGNNISDQEWCNITNAQSGEYYILLIVNNSNDITNIIFNQSNVGQVNAGNTNCSTCVCYFDNITYTINPCNPITNSYTINGIIIFHYYSSTILTGNITIIENISGQYISIPAPFTSPQQYNFINLPSDGLQHTLTATFTDAPNNTYTVTYLAPDTCTTCTVNAGTNLQFCGLSGSFNAIESNTDLNTHWLPLSEITFANINSPTSTVTANNYGTYNLVWQITNSSSLTCTDTITVEFINPALCTSVIKNSTNESFSVFPNPTTNGSFTINYSSKDSEKIFIRIITSQGVEIYNKEYRKDIESIEIPINTVTFVKGYYFIELISYNNIYRSKILIQ